MLRDYIFGIGLHALLLGVALAQASDPLVGAWRLNRGQSQFEPPSTLQSRTLVVEANTGGVKVIQRTVTQNGNTVEIEYTAGYDSKDVPISNSPLDTVALKRVNPNVVERVGKIRGAVTETSVMTLSSDRKTLTITTKGSASGTDYSSTQVYERQ